MISKKFARGGAFILALVVLAISATGVGVASADNGSAYGASSASLSISTSQSGLGTFLTGPDGLTLYVFKKDAINVSNCQADCLVTWPALLLSDGQAVAADASLPGSFGSISTRAGNQVTYNGAPLYYYAGDKVAGDTNGDGIGGVWSVARPSNSTPAPADRGVSGSNNAPGNYSAPGADMGGY